MTHDLETSPPVTTAPFSLSTALLEELEKERAVKRRAVVGWVRGRRWWMSLSLESREMRP